VNIFNLGSADLNVTGVIFTGSGDFTSNLGNPTVPFVVPAGGGPTPYEVNYLTPDTGDDFGEVTIQSDDPDEPEVMVGLDGNGV
jgi:hypothetical protein